MRRRKGRGPVRKLQAVGLIVAMAWLGVSSPALAAGKYDGSVPMLCAVMVVSECEADGQCKRTSHQVANIPTFIRVDVQQRALSAHDGSGRTEKIKASSLTDSSLVLQGGEGGRWWNVVIGSGTGRMGASVVEDDGAFAIFGACTLLP